MPAIHTPSRHTIAASTAATLTTALLTALIAKRRGDSAVAPMNAVSHIAHGEKAAHRQGLSLKYTLMGFALHHAANMVWGALHQRLGRDSAGTASGAVARGVATAATAYLIDYHVMPRKLRPGFEKRMSKGERIAVFAVMALALPLGEFLAGKPKKR